MLTLCPQARRIKYPHFLPCFSFIKCMVLGWVTGEASRSCLETLVLHHLPNKVHSQQQDKASHTSLTLFPSHLSDEKFMNFCPMVPFCSFIFYCFSARLCSTQKLAYTNTYVLNIYYFLIAALYSIHRDVSSLPWKETVCPLPWNCHWSGKLLPYKKDNFFPELPCKCRAYTTYWGHSVLFLERAM